MLILAWGQVYGGRNVETIMKVRMQEGRFWRWSSQEMMVEMERRGISRTFVFDSTGVKLIRQRKGRSERKEMRL